MDRDCTVLMEIMEQQMAVYKELLALASEKQKVLVKGDIPELDKITKQEEALILRVGRLEEERSNVHLALADRFSLSAEELTLSELAKRTDDETARQFRQLLQDMTGVIKELTEINETNAQMIKSSLDIIDFSVNMLMGSKSAVYGKGEEPQPNMAKILDRKI